MARAGCWNHNVHYQPVILGAVPAGCGAALEVGCGDGLLARRLAERCGTVTAIDRDARMIALARSRAQAAGPGQVTFVEADFLDCPVTEASFDFACANTAAPGRKRYSPTSAGVPSVMRMSSAYEVGKTVCG